MHRHHPSHRNLLVLALAAASGISVAQITSPKEFFGFNIGDDYHLANYQQMVDYWRKLDLQSNRMQLVSIGKTEEGRDQMMAIISDPANLRNLAEHRRNTKTLAHARGLDDNAAKSLANRTRATVWIDGGLHANETLGAQQLIETSYQLLSRNDEETKRILKECVIIMVHANPDGMDLVSNWYMRRAKPEDRSLQGIPVLYQKYAGHDNNRDSYATNLAETKNMVRIQFREWFPQIVYNHHQTSPSGTIMFIPPFRNPFNYHLDPLVHISIDVVGSTMHQRLISQGKQGTVMRNGASFSNWWNGGVRTTVGFHNIIGILTETFGLPNPTPVNFNPQRQVPSIDLPNPVDPQVWKYRWSIDYSVEANYAILDYASRNREKLLFNFYRAGKNSIEKGSRDSWHRYPTRVQKEGEKAIKDPAFRDARGYVIPADQADFLTAIKFVNTLIRSGLEVHRATEPITINGRTYAAGSIVLKADQAFRPHLLDMMEPQDYPSEFQYPGGPPIAPYDSAGYTPAFTAGIKFDRLLEGFSGPFELIPDEIVPGASTYVDVENQRGYLFSAEVNDSFAAANVLSKAGLNVYRISADAAFGPVRYAAGTFYVSTPDTAAAAKAKAATGSMGLKFTGVFEDAPETAVKAAPPRIGLIDRYGGSMPSGWTRLVLENFKFDYSVLFPADVDAGSLKDKYDVILVPSGFNLSTGEGETGNLANDMTIPAELRRRMGNFTVAKSLPALRAFVDAGGTILAVGSSSAMSRHFDLPVENALVETDENGRVRPLPNEKFFVPGSVLRMKLDNSHPLAWGMPTEVDVMFDDNQTYRFKSGADVPSAKVGWFDTPTPLRSGWAWGQERLKDTWTVLDFPIGNGRFVMYSPEITFRAQPHGTYKLLFNALLRAGK